MAQTTEHYHITLGLPLLCSRRASFCFVAQCSSPRPPHPATQKTCQSQFTWSTVARRANGIPSSTPITTDPSKGSAEQIGVRYLHHTPEVGHRADGWWLGTHAIGQQMKGYICMYTCSITTPLRHYYITIASPLHYHESHVIKRQSSKSRS